MSKTIEIAAHDPTRGDLCACRRCDSLRTLSLAESHAMSAIQAAAWSPRSKRLAQAKAEALAEREVARAAYAAEVAS